ncbi:MAG: PQQ-binding-like beta-propeller repeat protein [Planctomycetota bacterium]
MLIHSPCAVLLVVAAFGAAWAAEATPVGHQPLRYFGLCHDGSGVIPDCDPVLTWNETEFAKQDGKKYDKPVGRKPVNIVYKVPDYNWCHAAPIVVGGRVYTINDRGGYGFYADRAAEFASVELTCRDPATGEELWRKDLVHWDLVPNGAHLHKLVLEYNQLEARIYGAYAPMGSAMRNRGRVPLTPERYLKLAEPLRELIPDLPATLADIKGHIIDSKGYEQIHFFGKVAKKYFPELVEMRKQIQDAGYLLDPWGGKWDPLGISMMTPVSDGKHIYISTAFGAVYCVDLDGAMVWKRWYGGGFDRAPAIPSPILVGDVLVVTTHDPEGKPNRGVVRMGINKRTGETLWTAPFGGGYQASPVALRLHIGGDPSQPMDVIYYGGNGVVLRAPDGKQLAANLAGNGTGRPPMVAGDVVVLPNKSADGGRSKEQNPYEPGVCALRLSAPDADTVKAKALWQGKDLSWGGLVACDGVLFHIGDSQVESFALETGKTIASARNPGKKSRYYTLLAGNTLIGLDDHGFSTTAQVSHDGRIGQVHANRLGTLDYGKGQPNPLDKCFNYGAPFTASGNRIWIRSATHLYCIGDSRQPTRLSKPHQGDFDVSSIARAPAAEEAQEKSERTPERTEDKEERSGAAASSGGGAPDRGALAEALTKALAAGERPYFTMVSTGVKFQVTGFKGGNMDMTGSGMSMQFPLDRLSEKDLRALATALGVD